MIPAARRPLRAAPAAGCALLLLGAGAGDDTPPAPVSFHRQIRPLLQEHCQGCHQPAKPEGGLVLTDHASLLRGGRKGPVVVAGDPDGSVLIDEVTPWGGAASMPEDGDPLRPDAIDLLRRWIQEGAHDDTPAALAPAVTPEHPPVYHAPPVITTLDFSPDGALLAVSGDHEVLLFAGDGTALLGRLVGLSERISSVAFSPDGTRLAVAGGCPGRMGELAIWDVAERTLLRSVTVTLDTLYGVSWSPDGSRIAFGGADHGVRALDADSGREVLYQGAHEDWVLGTVFSRDGTHLASVSRDRSMKLIEVPTRQFLDNITSITPGALRGGLLSVDRHPDCDELVAGGADGTPRRYRMFREKKREIGDDHNLLQEFEPMPGRVFCVRFDRRGERIAAASSFERQGEVRVYAVTDGAVRMRFAAPCPVYAVAFSPDGSVLAAGGFDGIVRLLEAEGGAPIREFPAAVLERTRP